MFWRCFVIEVGDPGEERASGLPEEVFSGSAAALPSGSLRSLVSPPGFSADSIDDRAIEFALPLVVLVRLGGEGSALLRGAVASFGAAMNGEASNIDLLVSNTVFGLPSVYSGRFRVRFAPPMGRVSVIRIEGRELSSFYPFMLEFAANNLQWASILTSLLPPFFKYACLYPSPWRSE